MNDKLTPGQIAQVLREVVKCTDSELELNPFALGDRANALDREEAARREGEQKPEACAVHDWDCRPTRPCVCLRCGATASLPAEREGMGSAAAFERCAGCITPLMCTNNQACLREPEAQALQTDARDTAHRLLDHLQTYAQELSLSVVVDIAKAAAHIKAQAREIAQANAFIANDAVRESLAFAAVEAERDALKARAFQYEAGSGPRIVIADNVNAELERLQTRVADAEHMCAVATSDYANEKARVAELEAERTKAFDEFQVTLKAEQARYDRAEARVAQLENALRAVELERLTDTPEDIGSVQPR